MGNLNNMDAWTENLDCMISPPMIYLDKVLTGVREEVKVCSQNVSSHSGYGAFTGETSSTMLNAMGIRWTLVGHSERRAGFGGMEGESSEVVAQKTSTALSTSNFNVVVCIGETLDQREAGETLNVVLNDQLAPVVSAIQDLVDNAESKTSENPPNLDELWSRVVIAYEPVWAIGTGVTATSEQAQEVHSSIRF